MKKVNFFSLAVIIFILTFTPVYAAETPLVYDGAGILTPEETERLNAAARDITQKYKCEARVYTVSDFSGGDIYAYACRVYESNGFGYGEGKDGVLLLLSMAARDYAVAAYGFGGKAFTEYGRNRLLDDFVLPELAQNHYASAFDSFLSGAADYFEMARNGKPFNKFTDPQKGFFNLLTAVLGALLLGSLVAAVPCFVWLKQMKTAVPARDATRYVTQEGLKLLFSRDIFIRRAQTRRKIQSSSSSGASARGGGGFSGGSGKF